MEKQVGDLRKFSNDDRMYKIREILEKPEIRMVWRWDTGICPNCKHALSHEFNHTFYRIEILGRDGVENKYLIKEDITMLGYTTDGKTLILTIDKYDEVLAKSELFKNLVGKK